MVHTEEFINSKESAENVATGPTNPGVALIPESDDDNMGNINSKFFKIHNKISFFFLLNIYIFN